MKALPSRPLFRSCPRLLGSLCLATALVLAFPVPSAQAADLTISGVAGGAGQDNTVTGGTDATPTSSVETGAAYGTVTVSGGAGGKGGIGIPPNNGGAGGKGGAANLTLSGNDVSVNVLTIQGGTGGAKGGGDNGGAGGAGGDASFTANTLRTGNISLTTNDGDVTFTLNNALVWTGSGAFTVTRNTGTAAININSLTIDGGTVNSANYSNLISADSFYTDKTITLGDNGATFNTAGGDQTVGRKLIGTGGLTKEGAGTLTLTGSNAYGGGTTIKAGTLKGNIAANTALTIDVSAKYDGAGKARSLSALNGEGNVLNTNGLIVQSGTFSGVIDRSNTGGLTKDGAGTLELTGTNTYTGDTTIKAGTLALSGGGTLGASSLLDLRGGALDISGIAPTSLSLPDMDVRGPARLDIGDRTADFSGKTLSFYVPSDMGAGGTLLSVGGAGITDIGNSTVRVGIAGSSSPLDEGDAVTLIDAPDGTLQGDPANTGSKGEGMQGVTLRYAFDVARIGNRLTATVAEAPKTDPRAKALSEGFVGGLSLSLQGADLAAGRGMESAVRASSATARAGTSAFAGFGALSGGVLRSNTGSHVDMNSLSLPPVSRGAWTSRRGG